MKKKLLLAFGFLTSITSFAQSTNPAPYCAAGFKNVAPFDLPDRLISNVSFGTLANNSGNTRWPGAAYVFYNNLAIPNIVKGNTTPLTVNYNNNATHRVLAFIDLNKDNDFNDVGETVMDAIFPFNTGTTVNVTIPNTVANGQTRLRVLLYVDDLYTGTNGPNGPVTPCTNVTINGTPEVLAVGETEDYTINIVSNLSLDDFNQDQFSIYPNPSQNVVNIESKNNLIIESVKIVDLSGKLIIEKNQNTNQVDIENLSNGMYIVEVASEGRIYKKKLIKN
ncbi:T9SS type A sorting domain-containing protein [Flavobacterium macrobrachii]|uniref:T9SS type A sorting domain-containing protein n=1 Tax=Flavobacterium macrobrachii TaxID=591204 RepID=A0ABS2CTP3_9FLAO|nr:T9SS type A sorting domain-containing protein [Flavobacterium macrobrachii]MBM6498300.1 T9SS type A sorting domain-containing protein [Flavobacterium macrobrachii]